MQSFQLHQMLQGPQTPRVAACLFLLSGHHQTGLFPPARTPVTARKLRPRHKIPNGSGAPPIYSHTCSARATWLAPPASSAFDAMCHTCWGDVLVAPTGILLIICWTKMIQVVGRYSMLPIPAIESHPADPVAAYSQFITASLTSSPSQSLLTISSGKHQKVVTINMLSCTHAGCPVSGLLPLLPAQLTQAGSHCCV